MTGPRRTAAWVGVLIVLGGCDRGRPHIGGRSAQEWIAAVRDSGVSRTDAVAAIGQLASQAAADGALGRALDNTDPAVRLLVIDGIGFAGSRAHLNALEHLTHLVRSDPVDSLRARAAWAMGRTTTGERDAVSTLVVALRDSAPVVRIEAANALAAVGSPARLAAMAPLRGLLLDADTAVRRAGREAMAALRATSP